jgi:hypothetical protein
MVGLDEQCLNNLFDELKDWEDNLSHCEFYKNPANSSLKNTDKKDNKAPINPKKGGAS